MALTQHHRLFAGIIFARFFRSMGTGQGDSAAIDLRLLKYETLERLKQAIDYRQQRLLESAKQEWEHRFAGPGSERRLCQRAHQLAGD